MAAAAVAIANTAAVKEEWRWTKIVINSCIIRPFVLSRLITSHCCHYYCCCRRWAPKSSWSYVGPRIRSDTTHDTFWLRVWRYSSLKSSKKILNIRKSTVSVIAVAKLNTMFGIMIFIQTFRVYFYHRENIIRNHVNDILWF